MGFRRETYDDKGNLLSVVDTRTVEEEAAKKIQEIRSICAIRIEETGLPWMVQREVSGGSPIAQSVKDTCQAYRAKSDTLIAQVELLVGEETVDNVADICDDISAICW